jgi:F-type H+-transporting ATPase subunit a
MTALLIALSLTLAQHGGHDAAGGDRPEVQASAPEGSDARMVREQPATEGHGEAATGHAPEGAAEGKHGAEGHGGGGLSEQLMHHVTDGYVLEYPGMCEGHFAWNCEVDLKEKLGDKLVFTVGGVKFDMTPTKHLIMMWLATILLLVLFASAVRRKALVPRGLYNFLEMLVQFVRNEIALKNIGPEDGERFVPYLVSAFFFILFVNLFGLIPYAATATGNLAVTVAMALFTFVITQYAGIKSMGLLGWLKHLTGGVHWLLWPIMIPVEILGLFTKPFALTVRLFANMIAGHIVILSLIGLIYALGSQWVALGSVPMALGIFMLELFVGFVQAYIFTMLSSVFIGQQLAHHDHGEEHEGHAGPGVASADGHGSHGSHVAGTSPGHG